MSAQSSDRRLVVVLLAVLGALVVLPLLTMGLGMMGGGMYGGGMYGGGMYGGGMWGGGHMWDGQMGPGGGTAPGWVFLVGALLQVLFLAALVGVGYLFYRAVTGAASGGRDDAIAELRRAYARGDLDDEEFERRRERLERE
ncbi:SHOCT domain-containing protein [Haloarcula brevis]|uniref:SHOCT domain-containing protein n=1 Tax=Haloarcula brevis TaxID=3111453 RepID=UPI00300E8D38